MNNTTLPQTDPLDNQKTGSFRIDPEFRDMIPPLTDEEKAGLEASLRAEGCRDALTVWDEERTLLDGHNRFDICTSLGISYEINTISLPDRTAAIIWIIQNQLGRRNLSDASRIDLAQKLEPLVRAKAKENLKTGAPGIRGGSPLPNLAKGIDTRATIAEIAGVSPENVRRYKIIENAAPKETIAAVKSGKVSINAAYKALPKKRGRSRRNARPRSLDGFSSSIDRVVREVQTTIREARTKEDTEAIGKWIDTQERRLSVLRIEVSSRDRIIASNESLKDPEKGGIEEEPAVPLSAEGTVEVVSTPKTEIQTASDHTKNPQDACT